MKLIDFIDMNLKDDANITICENYDIHYEGAATGLTEYNKFGICLDDLADGKVVNIEIGSAGDIVIHIER